MSHLSFKLTCLVEVPCIHILRVVENPEISLDQHSAIACIYLHLRSRDSCGCYSIETVASENTPLVSNL